MPRGQRRFWYEEPPMTLDDESDDALDATTLGPEAERARAAPRPALRLVYAPGGARGGLYALAPGQTPIGRAVDSVLGVRVDADPRMSRHHATLLVADDGRVRLKNESKHPALRNGEPLQEGALADGDVLQLGDSFFVLRLVPADVVDAPVQSLLGVSPAAVRLRSTVQLIAPTNASVLILGPTGAGKEVMARALHERSGRRGQLVAVNTTAIPETLAESMLFGHVSGAFTGATSDHVGTFLQAKGGTLFLDEIGDLPLSLQPKLLRALDERRVTPVGSRESIPVDARIIAATNADLEDKVRRGAFRGDLYARLAEITVRLPPLSARREDVMPLLESALPKGHAPLEPALVAALLRYDWPFNVREVIKVATELAVRGAGRALLTLDLVEDRLRAPERDARARSTGAHPMPSLATDGARAAPEREPVPSKEQLVALLEKHQHVISDVARSTGRSRKQVYRWMDQYGLRAQSEASED
jgi:DNA-binding NtrC family response regulator